MNWVVLTCHNCTESLANSVFIACAECAISVSNVKDIESPSTSATPKAKALRLCLDCFSCGAELGDHKRTHRYYVKSPNHEMHLFSGQTLASDTEPWSAREEFGLLDGIERFNLGNWEDVANHYVKAGESGKSRTPREILEHYDQFYLHGRLGQVVLEPLKRTEYNDYTSELTVTVNSDTDGLQPDLKVLPSPPMRDSLRKISPDDFRLLAYMPQRDDFEKEYNNDAETLISNLMILPDDDDLDKAVKGAQIEMYIQEVVERQRRKTVAREYDLVSQFFKQEKSFSTKAAYSYSVPEQKKLKMERELRTHLKTCAQFVPAAELDQLIMDIVKERLLKERIKELQDYRQAGITTLEGEKKLKANENSTLKHQSSGDAVDEFASPIVQKRTSTAGTVYASGKSELQKRTREFDPSLPILSHFEMMFCEEFCLTSQDYVLLKTAVLNDQTARLSGLPLRANAGGGTGSVEDILELKSLVKEFMKRSLVSFCVMQDVKQAGLGVFTIRLERVY